MTIEKNNNDAALRWVARQQANDLSAADEADFERWRATPANAAAYEEALFAAASLDGVADEMLAREFEAELNALADEGVRRATPWRAIAASVTLAAGLALGFFFASPRDVPTAHYATALGETENVALSDGSAVMLNSASAIDVSYAEGERRVAMARGEAFFNVARDTDRPFVISTPAGRVIVTGTSFNVRLDGDATTVSVLSGAVDVYDFTGAARTLMAGQSVAVDGRNGIGDILQFDPTRAIAWRDGRARFKDTPLAEALGELNRYFDAPITLGDPSLGALPVSGEFSLRDREIAAQTLAVAFSLEIERRDGQLILRPSEADETR